MLDVGKFVKVKKVKGLVKHGRPLKNLEGMKAEIIKINKNDVHLLFFNDTIKTIKKDDAYEILEVYELNKVEKDQRQIKEEYELKRGESSRSRSRSRAAPKKKSKKKKSKTIQRLGGGSRRRSLRRSRGGSRRRSLRRSRGRRRSLRRRSLRRRSLRRRSRTRGRGRGRRTYRR